MYFSTALFETLFSLRDLRVQGSVKNLQVLLHCRASVVPISSTGFLTILALPFVEWAQWIGSAVALFDDFSINDPCS